MDWVDWPQNYKGLYRILQLMQGFHLDNFPLKTLKIDWVAFLLATLQSKCLDFQSYKMNIKNLSQASCFHNQSAAFCYVN